MPQIKVLSFNCWYAVSSSLTAPETDLLGYRRGLKFVADKRRERMLGIADWIARSTSRSAGSTSRNSYHSDEQDSDAELSNFQAAGYDVIALQEIWVRDDFDLIASRAKEAGLHYSRFFDRFVRITLQAPQ